MSYPGNPSIASETQTRILTTFNQTLDLARQGRIQEAALGCDFVLKMDPLFERARELQKRLDVAAGPVEVEDLVIAAEEPAASPMSAPETVVIQPGDPLLDSLSQPAAMAPAPPAAPAAPEAPPALGDDVFSLDIPEASDTDSPGGPAGDDPLNQPLPSFDAPSLEGPGGLGDASLGSPGLEAPSLDPPILGESLGSGAYSPEAAARIQELLTEGRSSLDRGEFQEAIDSWSRIFLIDIDHKEANQLIEQARQLKAEQERALEERYHEAVDLLDRGELDTARSRLQGVLEADPRHVGAREHLDRLDRGELSPGSGGVSVGAEGVPEAAGGFDDLPAVDDAVVGDTYDPDELPLEELPAPVGGTPKPKKASKMPSWMPLSSTGLVAVGVVGLVLVVGWMLLSNWSNFFPNADSDAAAVRPPSVDLLQEAKRLYLAGDLEQAIQIAGRIPPISPDKEEARTLITRWREEFESQAQTATADVVEAPVEEVLDEGAELERLLERARRAYRDREFFAAARNFQAAAKLTELDESSAALFADARDQLRPIQQQLRMFRDGEWKRLLAPLWRLRVDDEQNMDVRNLLVDCYFNLALRDLRAGNPDDALPNLAEAAELDPEDPVVARMREFAEAYSAGGRDLQYDIFVRNVDYRALADRG